MDNLDERLAIAKTQSDRLISLKSDSKKLEKELLHVGKKLKKLEKIMIKEKADYERLVKVSFSSVLHSLLRNKKKKIEKEKHEFFNSKNNCDLCKEQMLKNKSELNDLNKQISELGHAETTYKSLLKLKEQKILSNQSSESAKLTSLDQKIQIHNKTHQGLNDSIKKGNRAIQLSEKLAKTLSKAQDWGTFDMLGGGTITTAIKHDKIGQAKSLVHLLQDRLDAYNEGLRSVQKEIQLGEIIEIGGFGTFADFFLDGLIADYAIQRKIRDSLARIRKVQFKIHSTQKKLSSERTKIKRSLIMLEKQKEEILLSQN